MEDVGAQGPDFRGSRARPAGSASERRNAVSTMPAGNRRAVHEVVERTTSYPLRQRARTTKPPLQYENRYRRELGRVAIEHCEEVLGGHQPMRGDRQHVVGRCRPPRPRRGSRRCRTGGRGGARRSRVVHSGRSSPRSDRAVAVESKVPPSMRRSTTDAVNVSTHWRRPVGVGGLGRRGPGRPARRLGEGDTARSCVEPHDARKVRAPGLGDTTARLELHRGTTGTLGANAASFLGACTGSSRRRPRRHRLVGDFVQQHARRVGAPHPQPADADVRSG